VKRKQLLQAARPRTQDPQRAIDSPYLTSKEALIYLRLPSLSSLYSHIRENRLPVCRVGGDLRFDTRELDAWVRGFGSAIEMVRSKRSA
jgi:excisionase family DNA binding protein